MAILKVEEWEQSHINTLTIKLIIASAVATLFATGITVALTKVGVPAVRPELLFAPWGIALVIGVSIAFHRGVMAERARTASKK